MAFKGETISDTLAAVIRGEPDWTLLPAGVPFSVQQLIRRCLNKDARQRLQSIGEARIAIENIMEGRDATLSGSRSGIGLSGISGAMPGSSISPAKENRVLKIIAGSALAVLLVAAGFLLASILRHDNSASTSAIRFAIDAVGR